MQSVENFFVRVFFILSGVSGLSILFPFVQVLEIQQTASVSDAGVNEVNGEDDSGSLGKPSKFALYSGGE